jgi:hypothetical protein
MRESIHLNHVRDNQRPVTPEKSVSMLETESPKANFGISSDAPSIEDLMRDPGEIDQEHESPEADSAAKEYSPPLLAWKLFTIVFGCVQPMSPSLPLKIRADTSSSG